MGNSGKKEINFGMIAMIAYIVAVVLDVILVFVLKGRSGIFRWLWLPIISFVLAIVAGMCSAAYEERFMKLLFGIPLIIWGILRAIIIVMAYFQAANGFFAVLGAILLCLFMFIFNAFSFIMSGIMAIELDLDGGGSSPTSTATYFGFRFNSQPSVTLGDEEIKKPYRPRQGNLVSYFNGYTSVPQSGSMYFWHSYPSMCSSYSHSSYTITGTIGIRKQSIEAFHVTDTDMDHHLRSVTRDMESYVDEIISKYRRDYPDDDTDFKVDINLDITVVG